MKKILLAFAVIILSNNLFGQLQISKPILGDNKFQSSLDSIVSRSVQNYFKDSLAVGVSIGIIQNGKSHTYNYGETQKGSYDLPKSNTIYEIGSISKTLTGVLLAQAVLDKKLNLYDDIRKYLDGDYPNLQYQNHPIKIVQLSNHTSRIPSNTDNIEDQKPFDITNPFANYTDAMFDEGLHSVVLDTIPGTKQTYSNMGVALLGKIIAKQYKMTYLDAVKKYILTPNNMSDTKVSLTEKEYKRFAIGYNKKGKQTSYWDCKEFVPAGGIRSTVDDMLKYVEYNLKENAVIRLAHPKTYGSNQDGNALGWGINELKKNELLFWHEGSTGGFTAMCVVIPSKNSGFIILTNSKADLSLLTSNLVNFLK
ncbi:serine hydrolase domain-containing protein [Flavobacterium sp. U410]